MRDVAAAAGVHASTVSLALRRHPSIPLPTRERIEACADALGYVINPLVAGLMRSRRRRRDSRGGEVLAWVTCFPSREGWRKSRYYAELFEGARERSEERGFELREFWIKGDGAGARRLAGVLRARGIRGLLIAPLPQSEGSLDLPWEQFSAVALGHTLASPELHRVVSRYARDIRVCCQMLFRLGYRRPGLCLPGGLDQRTGHEWIGGFLAEAHYRRPARTPVPWTGGGDDHHSFRSWLQRERPDVIITVGRAVGLLRRWIGETGLRIPEDAGLVDLQCRAGDSVAGIRIEPRVEGSAAVDILADLLFRNEHGVPVHPMVMGIGGRWSPGGTVTKIVCGKLRRSCHDGIDPNPAVD